MPSVDWYFDFISPYSYLCLHRFSELPEGASIRYRPVLLAGLLNHFGQKGPAEIQAKRLWTYRWCTWWAGELGVAFRFPALHPFNPLHHLRLCVAAGGGEKAIRAIFDDIWTGGADAGDPKRFSALREKLQVGESQLGAQDVKDALRSNTDEAIACGVFGVPSFVVDGEVFWGADSVGLLKDYLGNPALFKSEEMMRLASLPVGAARKP
jgi:2-hydroxychromene-2-carboxylate isomerase